jgi:lipid-A-disaccharide synthase
MVNLIAGKSVVPEFIQDEATPARLAAAVGELLSNPHYRELMLQELDRVREKLGPPGGAQQAAEIIVEFLERVEST